jgi:hypothetical protein
MKHVKIVLPIETFIQIEWHYPDNKTPFIYEKEINHFEPKDSLEKLHFSLCKFCPIFIFFLHASQIHDAAPHSIIKVYPIPRRI